MNAGLLKRRITIQSQSSAQDAAGEELQNWTDVVTCWGSIHSATSKEVYSAAGFTSQLTHVITIRYTAYPAAKAGMRVSYDARTFRVQAVDNQNQANELLVLMCLEEQ